MNPAANPIEKKQRIESLYLLKAICSFFVVMIHSACWFKDNIYFILGVGTPCFLSITGYLLYSNNCSKELNKALSYQMGDANRPMFTTSLLIFQQN